MKRYVNEVEQWTENGLIVIITTDPDPESPREWDNAGTMVCFHKRYNLGDKHDFPTPEAFRLWWEEYGEGGTILPLHLYDHSGLTISTTPFSCPWDSGQVGWIYLTRERQEREHIEDPVSYLKGEVATYDEFLRGDVYCFSIEDNGNVIDGSCGYFGLEHCREEARHVAKGVMQP